MTNEELQSKTISFLRFPLTILVVFIHFNLVNGLSIHGHIYGLDNPAWYFFIINLISNTLARTGVPLFFLFSGYFFFYGKDFNKQQYLRNLKSRVITLFVPFILWNVIAIMWNFKCLLPFLSSFYRPIEIHISFLRIINTFLCNNNINGIFVSVSQDEPSVGVYPIDVPMWYIRDLLFVNIFSPFVFLIIKKMKIFYIITLGLIWFFSFMYVSKGNYVNYLLTAFFFFSWGAYFSINKKNLVFSLRKYKNVLFVYLFVAIIDTLTKGLEYNLILHRFSILLGIVSIVVIASYLLEFGIVKINVKLTNCSFFIYALHYMFIEEIGKYLFIMLHISGNNPYFMLFLYFIVPFFSILLCVLIYFILKKYAFKFCNLLTGGR